MNPGELQNVLAFQKVVHRISQWIVLFYCFFLEGVVIFDHSTFQRKYFVLAYVAGIAGLGAIGLWLLHRPKQLKPWTFILTSIGLMGAELLLAAIALGVENPTAAWLYSGIFPILLAIIGVYLLGCLLWTPPKQGGSSTGKKQRSNKPKKHSQKRPAKKRTHYNLPPALTNPPPSGGKGKR